MYRQIKNIYTCILLYISIKCSNGLLCYSCYGKNNALDCEIITCKLSLFGDLRTVCYYQVFESGYQRRGCENVTSVLSQLTEGNMTLYYCREDYCNGYSNVFLNDTRRQYKSRETLVPDLKPSWDSTVHEYSSLTGDNIQGDSTYNDIFLIIIIICLIVAMICLYCCIIKSKCQETSHSFLNTNTARHRSTDLEYCGNNSNYYSDISYNIGRSNLNDYRDYPYSYGETNCGSVNDLGSGGNDDDGGGDYGGGDCGGDDYGGGDCGGDDYGGGDCGSGDSGGGDCGGGDCGGDD
ncbi:uncharacterized protein LOC107271437 isoform X2 [Cephus cinctus]|uniref:Uncharacterized protein LOC107271437 isoform X2 n=1 Tax=Cephus cinctus TaxID=211228 RepID=A0AAJ7FQA8_CEPCN|nr:uncharacterized protein LOC107271437 isoform X2 [Cephus cinctus]